MSSSKYTTDGQIRLRHVLTGVVRVAVDASILALWTVFLTLVYLWNGWPLASFYVVLLVGALGYVLLTSGPFENRS